MAVRKPPSVRLGRTRPQRVKPRAAVMADLPAKPLTGGRPRSEVSRVALLETAYDLMKKHSLSEISTQQICGEGRCQHRHRVSLVADQGSVAGRCLSSY